MTDCAKVITMDTVSNINKIILAIVVVVALVAAGAFVMFNDSSSDKAEEEVIASKLQICGNANDDYTIDDKDMDILNDILSGKKNQEDYPLADVNGDGEINEADKTLLQDLIDRKEGSDIYVLCLDENENNTVVKATYPLRNVVPYGTNIQEPTLYANGGQYVAGYFSNSYKNLEASLSHATELGSSARKISDESWAKFTNLDSEKKIGALLVDYSGISQMTEPRVNDLEEAGIPMIVYKSADAISEVQTVLTLSFLFGEECEKTGVKYAKTSWNIFKQIDDKVGDLKDDQRATYIAFTMWIYVCQNDSTFNSSPATAGGLPYYKVNEVFANAYAGSGSDKMKSTEALSNYDDADVLISNRSMDFGNPGEESFINDVNKTTYNNINELIDDTWNHSSKKGGNYIEYFENLDNYESLIYVNNLLPGAVKVAYMANALYGDLFSDEWADSILQDFIDMGLAPFEGQTMKTIPATITYEDWVNSQKD